MEGFLGWCCGEVDCSNINPLGPCFEPDVLPNHTNYCLNLIYKQRGICWPDVGHIVTIDPCT
ncbi:hypothetical protein ACS0TY_003007 [Phlomoides rotata]